MTLPLGRGLESRRSGGRLEASWRIALALSLLATLTGCSAGKRPSTIASPGGGYSCLFRAELDGNGPNPHWRMILRSWSADGFQLSASGPFGGRLWTLWVGPHDALWLDYRGQRYCRGDAEASEWLYPEMGGIRLPWRSVPAVLGGRIPVESLAPKTDGEVTVRDEYGQDWQVRWENGVPVAWSFSRDGVPLLSWHGSAEQGQLEDRTSGMTLRWRVVGCEEVAVPQARPEPEPDMVEWICHEEDLPELRQDQSPLTGGGYP